MGNYAFGSGNNHDAHVSGWQELLFPIFELADFGWVSGLDWPALVYSAKQLNLEFSLAPIVDELEFAYVPVQSALCEEPAPKV